MNALGLFTEQSYKFSKLLIEEKGADLNIKTFSGSNCFHQLAMMNPLKNYKSLKFVDYPKFLESKAQSLELYQKFYHLFVSSGMDINEKNLSGHSPLSIALNEKNRNFLELLTKESELQVDRLVHEKSELHNFKEFVFDKKAPKILVNIIKKSKDFSLLMQLYDTDTGYNAFHDVLNQVVTKFTSHINMVKSQYQGKYSNYLRLVNNAKAPLFDTSIGKSSMRIVDDDEEDDEDDEEYGKGIQEEEVEETKKIVQENLGSGELENDVKAIRKKLNKLKAKLRKKIEFDLCMDYARAKSQLYQPKYINLLCTEKREELKNQIIEIFKTFEQNGYDFSEKVRLYKKKITNVSVVEKGKQQFNRHNQTPSTPHRIKWKNKNYTVNVEAKNTVFHILMKNASTYLFDYFKKKVKLLKNECNFLGYSLIHYLVKNFNNVTPKMDIKVHNKDYDYEKEIMKKKRKIQQEAKDKTQPTQPFEVSGGLFNNPTPGFGIPSRIKQIAYKHPRKAAARKKIARRVGFGKPAEHSTGVLSVDPENINLVDETVLVMKRLLNLKENPNLPNKNNEFPIIKVCTNGGNELLHLLVQNKTNLNVLDKRGNTPLLIFVKRRDLRSCEYLLENEADITLRDHKGRNALHWSLNQTTPQNSNNFDLEEILLEKGVNLNEKDKFGRPPIFYLFTKVENEFINTKLDPIEIFSYMISFKGMDLEQIDYLGNRLIHYLAQRGSYLCMIYLLREKVSINALNNYNNSALNISIINKQNDVAIILLQSNAEVNKSIQIVDFKTMREYKKYKELKEKEKDQDTQAIAEEEEEEEPTKLELEDETGFIKERILDQFKEDSESEEEEEWHDFIKKMSSKNKKNLKKMYLMEEEEEEDLVEESEENNQHGYRTYKRTSYNMFDLNSNYHSTWQINSMKQNLRQKIEKKLKKKQKWEQLEKMAAKNFISEQGSQFKFALRNAMLSVNFLLVDFKFNLGQAIMDTISIRNWDYTKTLLNKKMKNEMFQFVDNKGRNVMHYLAYFGASLSQKDLEYFLEKFEEKGIQTDLSDCLDRSPIHYAALKGNLTFINSVKKDVGCMNQKDLFGNTLLSLYLRSNSISRETLRIFVEDFENDVNLKFLTSNDDFVKDVESFNFWTMEPKELKKKLKKCLQQSPPKIQFFDMELKLREGQKIPQIKKSSLKSYSTLLYATWVKKDFVLTENLIEVGADINLQDENGETILSKAIVENKIKLLEILKKYSDQIDFTKGIIFFRIFAYLKLFLLP
jgi:ankyrin repeat protein